MKKSTEPSRGEMNKASTIEAKLSSKAEYVEKLRKDNEVYVHVAIGSYKHFSIGCLSNIFRHNNEDSFKLNIYPASCIVCSYN